VLTGRKLLLADDSAAIRKVIELTFSDEGMEVITVSDGRSAFEKMGQLEPDLVLADVYMPEIDGYELCRSIKQDERFRKTPVILLISSFEPFDEAEARRAGADDVVTKPFQSIRQLVSRVGALLSGGAVEPALTDEYPPMGVKSESILPVAPPKEEPSERQVTVLVEAPTMEHLEPAEPTGATSSTDIELLTADTMQLEPIVTEPVAQPKSNGEARFEDTLEVAPVSSADYEIVKSKEIEFSQSDMNEPSMQTSPAQSFKRDDEVLDLQDEYLIEAEGEAGDVFLDLDFADSVSAEPRQEPVVEPEVVFVADDPVPVEVMAETDETPSPVTPIESAGSSQFSQEPWSQLVPEETAPVETQEVENLSPAAIDAIARRMVEQMSDKVIREIAWEVVPELSELLIKERLSEQK